MKLIIIIFLTSFHWLSAQSYEKDWARINERLEAGAGPGIETSENFLLKYRAQLNLYPDNTTQLYSVIAGEYSQAGNPAKAEENYLQSLVFAQKAKDTTLKFIVMYSLAVLHYNNSELLEAEKYYSGCLAGMAFIYGQSSREYTSMFSEYVSLLVDLGKYSEAKPYIEALLYYYKTLDGENNHTYLKILTSKAIVAQNLGDYASAASVYATMVKNESILKLGDTLGHVIQTGNLGDVYREMGDNRQALYYSELAESLYYMYQLDVRRAKPYERQVLASIENNLGLIYKAMSDPQKAEAAYDKALAVYRENGGTNTETYCTTLSNKANLFTELGRNAEASELLWEAIDIRKKYFGERSENYANALANLAIVFQNSGHFQEALEKNLEAREIYKNTVGVQHQSYATSLNNLSLCYLQLKDYQEAEACKLEALCIIASTVGKDHYRYASFLISTSDLYRQMRQPEKAIKNLKEALQLVERNLGKKHELYARAQFALAELYAVDSRFDEAGGLFVECLDYYSEQLSNYFNAMSEENQTEFLANLIPLYQSYNLYLINYKLLKPDADLSEHLKRALKYQLQMKSLLANRSAQVRKEISASSDKNLKAMYQEWRDLKTELINRFKSAEPFADNNDLYLRSSQLEIGLKAKIKGFSTAQPASFVTLQQNLQQDEAAIEIFKTVEIVNDSSVKTHYGALLVKNGIKAPVFIVFKDGDLLDEAAFEHYEKRIDEQLPDSLSYGIYFSPFSPFLKSVKKIYISSDGIFNKLSFAGLMDPGNKKYLFDRFEIYQTSNLASLSKSNGTSSADHPTAVLFGYPDYEYDFKKNKTQSSFLAGQMVASRFGLTQLSKLPGTKKEVEEIDKELKAKNWHTDLFINEFASEKNLRNIEHPKVLHIATHGFYLKDVTSEDKLFLGFERSAIRGNSFLRSGIILAGAGPATQDSTNTDSENDGILTAGEASLLDLNNTDLVVLSACQTGLGDEMGTEGVAGLQRSFAIAGAKNILMSLWPVDDEATRLLMTEFYKSYALTRDAAVSFKSAQAAVKLKYSQPYYWAAFVLLKTFN